MLCSRTRPFCRMKQEIEEPGNGASFEPGLATISDEADTAEIMKGPVNSMQGAAYLAASSLADSDSVPYFQRVSVSGDDNTGVSYYILYFD